MSALHTAVNRNDKKSLVKLLKKPKDLNAQDSYGQTPLHLSCIQGNYEFTKMLLDRGANPNAVDKNDWTPLHTAANSQLDLRIPKILIDYGATVNARNRENTHILHYLVRAYPTTEAEEEMLNDILTLMIEKHVDINPLNKHLETPLHQASFRGTVSTVKFLLAHGADASLTNTSGETSLHFAIRTGSVDKVRCLLEAKANPYVVGDFGDCVALAADQPNILEILKTESGFKPPKAAKKKKKRGGVDKPKKRKRKKKGPKYGVAFGTKRGACEQKDCLCDCYASEADVEGGGPCLSCGHFPAKHKNLGKVESGEKAATAEEPTVDPKIARILEGASFAIDYSELTIGDILGVGASARVFKGVYRGQEVAIKELKPIMDTKSLENFKKELDIMGSLRSPNVVYFFGVCFDPKICLVLEFCAKGSLFHALSNESEAVDWPLVFKVCFGTMKGINCLHSWKPQIVHRDLKSLNLLVDGNWNVKVCDFGLSRFTDQGNMSTLSKLRGTYAYCAPEVYFGERFSTKSDVFSVGIILWEVLYRSMTGKYMRPYEEHNNLKFDFQIIIQTAKKGLRPSMPENLPSCWTELVQKCWHSEVENRPEVPEIIEALEAIQDEYDKHSPEWDALLPASVREGSPRVGGGAEDEAAYGAGSVVAGENGGGEGEPDGTGSGTDATERSAGEHGEEGEGGGENEAEEEEGEEVDDGEEAEELKTSTKAIPVERMLSNGGEGSSVESLTEASSTLDPSIEVATLSKKKKKPKKKAAHSKAKDSDGAKRKGSKKEGSRKGGSKKGDSEVKGRKSSSKLGSKGKTGAK